MAELGRARPVVLAAIATILTANMAILASSRTDALAQAALQAPPTTQTIPAAPAWVVFGKSDTAVGTPTVFAVRPDASDLTPSARPPARTDQLIGPWTVRSFASNRDSSSIVIANLDGTQHRALTSGGYDIRPQVGGIDRRTIGYVRHDAAGANAIAFVSADGSDEGALLPPEGFSYDGFAWSPDGTRVAVARSDRRRESPAAVVVLSLLGRPPRVVATGDLSQLAWSHDGTRLVGVARTTDGDELWVLPLRGETTQITHFAAGAPRCALHPSQTSLWQPMWSPDDTQIAFLSHDVNVARADGSGVSTAYAAATDICGDPVEFVSLFGWAKTPNLAV